VFKNDAKSTSKQQTEKTFESFLLNFLRNKFSISHRVKACVGAEVAGSGNGPLQDGRPQGFGGRLVPLAKSSLVRQLGLGLGGGHVQQGVERDRAVQLLFRFPKIHFH